MLRLTAEQSEAVRRHAEADYPDECCGLLLGSIATDRSKAVVETLPISNARDPENRRNRFLITPDDFLRGEIHADRRGLEVVGFYHSHPDHLPVPSAFDLEHAWPAYSYLIVAVRSGQAGQARSWTLSADRSTFDSEPLAEGDALCQ